MRSIQPEYRHRFDIEEIRDSYASLEDAFAQGDYNLVAEFADDDSELLGEALILTGLVDQGVAILDRLPELSQRAKFHRAFAYWYLGDADEALALLDGIRETEPVEKQARALAELIRKPAIRMFNIATPPDFSPIKRETHSNASSYRIGQFDIKMIATPLSENAYDYSFNEPLDTFINSLPDEERPDFIMSMVTQWFVPKNLDKVDIPTVIWHHDQDLFIHRFYNNYFAHDVHLLCTSQEHYELSRAFGKFCVTNLLADVYGGVFPDINPAEQEGRTKDIDVLFTGSSITSRESDKPNFLFKLLTEARELKTLVVHGHLPEKQYEDLMSRAKSMPIISRLCGNPSPRWKDILSRGGMLLYPHGTVFGRICKGAMPYKTGSIAADIERHVSLFNNEMAGPGYRQAVILADSMEQMAQFSHPRVDRDIRLEQLYRYAVFMTVLQRSRSLPPTPWQTAKAKFRRRAWPMPAMDLSTFEYDNVLVKMFAALDHENDDDFQDDKDENNRAVTIFTILALLKIKGLIDDPSLIDRIEGMSGGRISRSDAIDDEYRNSLNLISEALTQYPKSLLLRFNQALFHIWPGFAPFYQTDRHAGTEHSLTPKGIALFERLIEDFDDLEFDPFGSDIGCYSQHFDDPVFPYTEYGPMVTKAAVEVDDFGRIRPEALADLRSVLLAAAHGYIGWFRLKKGLDLEALENFRSAKAIHDGNKKLASLKFLAGLGVHKVNPRASAALMDEIADDYFQMASLDPAKSMDEVDEIAFILLRLGKTAELERLLQDWYYFSRSIHVDELGKALIENLTYYYSLLEFEHLFPSELKANLQRIRGMTLMELEGDESLTHLDKHLGRLVVPGAPRPSILLRRSLRRKHGKRFTLWFWRLREWTRGRV